MPQMAITITNLFAILYELITSKKTIIIIEIIIFTPRGIKIIVKFIIRKTRKKPNVSINLLPMI